MRESGVQAVFLLGASGRKPSPEALPERAERSGAGFHAEINAQSGRGRKERQLL